MSTQTVAAPEANTPTEISTLVTVVRWLVILAMPFFLGFGMIRAVIAWDYPSFEYQRIPPDVYGFTPEERLFYAHATLDYLQRSEPAEEVIFLLEELVLPDGETPLYLESEISHMVDVKVLTDTIRNIWYVAAVIVVGGLIFLLAQPHLRPLGFKTIRSGGLLTVAILTVIALLILVAWSFFFVQFHELLFPPGTWTFRYSDSLIRLFPEQFWFDIGVIMSMGSLILGVITAVFGHLLLRRFA